MVRSDRVTGTDPFLVGPVATESGVRQWRDGVRCVAPGKTL